MTGCRDRPCRSIASGQAVEIPVHTADQIEGFLSLAEDRNARGRICHFSGRDEVSLLELTRLILEPCNVRKSSGHVPAGACRLLVTVIRKSDWPDFMRWVLYRQGSVSSPPR